jgi:hypothetical protein
MGTDLVEANKWRIRFRRTRNSAEETFWRTSALEDVGFEQQQCFSKWHSFRPQKVDAVSRLFDDVMSLRDRFGIEKSDGCTQKSHKLFQFIMDPPILFAALSIARGPFMVGRQQA